MNLTKSITFNKKAQDSLPEYIKERMGKDREQAESTPAFVDFMDEFTERVYELNKKNADSEFIATMEQFWNFVIQYDATDEYKQATYTLIHIFINERKGETNPSF